jgi:RNA polymerase sigma-70 factor, ECF subfamily
MMAEVDRDVLCALHARGRQAWPGIELDVATFMALAAQRWADGPPVDVHAGDFYLAMSCAAGIERAVAELDRHYLARVSQALVRRGHDAAAAADAVQAVRMRLLVGEDGRAPRIAEYDGRRTLATWIQVCVVRTAVSAYRRLRREIPADEVTLVAAERSPEYELLRHRFGAEFEAAFRTTFESLTARERNLLRYQVIDRLGIDAVAAIYGVHRATAARWIVHARETLLEGVRRALQERLRIDAPELDSLLRLVHSRLELSLRLLLTPTQGADVA